MNEEIVEKAMRQLDEVRMHVKGNSRILDLPIGWVFNKASRGDIIFPKEKQSEWTNIQKSRFIESIFLGLPTLRLVFREIEDFRLTIIDGFERVKAIKEFYDGSLELCGLLKLDALNGFKFTDIPLSTQRRFGNKSIYVFTLENKLQPNEWDEDICKRINTCKCVSL